VRNALFAAALLVMIVPSHAESAAASVATYESIQDLEGYKPLAFQPWSPDGRLLALIGKRGELYVWDVTQPERPPRMLAPKANELARWSPDGGWLLFEGYDRNVAIRQIAVRISDAHADTLLLPKVWPVWWASDGNIYGWAGEQPLRHRVVIDPPKLWLSEHWAPHPDKAVLFSDFGFLPGPKPQEWGLAVMREPGVQYVLLRNAFPGDSLYLAQEGGSHPMWIKNCVLNLRGNVVRELGRSDGVDWTSVSADGKYLLGEVELDTPGDAEHSVLYVGDSRGESSTRLDHAPEGVSPHWAPHGYLFCARDLVAGVVHVGRIRFEPR
jgi:hypothetical protein